MLPAAGVYVGIVCVEVLVLRCHVQSDIHSCSIQPAGLALMHDTRDGCVWCVCDRASVCSCGVFDFMYWCLISSQCCLLQESM